MKGAPWFKFWVSDFRGGTLEMTNSEVGAFVRLLLVQWEQGSLPDDLESLAMMACGPVSARVLTKFKKGPDGRLRSARMEKEREGATKRSAMGAAGADARWNADRKPEAMPESCGPHAVGITDGNADRNAEDRGQSTEDRGEKREDTEHKKELPATPQQPKPKRELVHRIESMPAGFESLLDLFNDWLEARKNTATAGAVKIALQRVQEWGLVKARAILSDAVVGRWDGLKDYGNHGGAQSTQPGGMNSERKFDRKAHDAYTARRCAELGIGVDDES